MTQIKQEWVHSAHKLIIMSSWSRCNIQIKPQESSRLRECSVWVFESDYNTWWQMITLMNPLSGSAVNLCSCNETSFPLGCCFFGNVSAGCIIRLYLFTPYQRATAALGRREENLCWFELALISSEKWVKKWKRRKCMTGLLYVCEELKTFPGCQEINSSEATICSGAL